MMKRELVTVTGLATFSIGNGLLNAYPALQSRYVSFFGTNGLQPSLSRNLFTAISEGNLDLVQRNYTAPLLTPDSPFYSTSNISNLGNSAMVEEANNILNQYGSRVSDISLDLSGVAGASQNIYTLSDGTQIRPDLQYSVSSRFFGTTINIDEIKGANTLSASASNLGQVSGYASALDDNAAIVAIPRAVGGALEVAGGALAVGSLAVDGYVAVTTGDASGVVLDGITAGAFYVNPLAGAAVLAARNILSTNRNGR